jgi:hypothetical protein
MCEDFVPNIGYKRICCCITTTQPVTLPFLPRIFFYVKQHDSRPESTLLASVSTIENKTERPPFSHKWGDWGRIAFGAEHDFHGAVKNARSAGNSAYARTGIALRLMVASRHKVSFDQMAALVPEIMDDCIIHHPVIILLSMRLPDDGPWCGPKH